MAKVEKERNLKKISSELELFYVFGIQISTSTWWQSDMKIGHSYIKLYLYTMCKWNTFYCISHYQSILFTKNSLSQMGWKRFSMDAFNARWLKYELTLYAPRCSTTHGRLASRPTATVTFGIGCAKRGSSIITVCRQKEEKDQSNLNIITKT